MCGEYSYDDRDDPQVCPYAADPHVCIVAASASAGIDRLITVWKKAKASYSSYESSSTSLNSFFSFFFVRSSFCVVRGLFTQFSHFLFTLSFANDRVYYTAAFLVFVRMQFTQASTFLPSWRVVCRFGLNVRLPVTL